MSLRPLSAGSLWVPVLAGALLAGCQAPKQQLVRNVDRLEADVSEGAMDVKRKSVRAWVEGIEKDGTAATLVHRLEANQNVQGLTISPDTTYLVFSVLEQRDLKKEGKEPEKESGSKELSQTFATLRAKVIGTTGVTQITNGTWHDVFPSFGPGNFITFSSNRLRRTGSDIFRISSEHSGGVSVIHQAMGAASFRPSVSKDGTMVYSYASLSSGHEPHQIWALGGSLTFPMQLREGDMPAVSPNGTDIAYVGVEGQLWVVSMGGQNQNQTQLTFTTIPKDENGERMTKLHPSWSPDGTHIVYAAADGLDGNKKPNYDIWIIPRNGGDAQQLTTNGSVDIYPVVSPSQQNVYFVSNRGFTEGIWRVPYPASAK